MKVLSVINRKGGVGKTVTSVNLAYNFAAIHGLRVLLIDLDAQGNASMFFNARSYERLSSADVLRNSSIAGVASRVLDAPSGGVLDIIQGNMDLEKANKEILLDCTHPQQTRLKTAIGKAGGAYDLVIIDNAPSVNMATINGLCAASEVIIPVTPDDFAADGLALLTSEIADIQEGLNPALRILGCVATNVKQTRASLGALKSVIAGGHNLMSTMIRSTCRVPESLAEKRALLEYAPTCTAAEDYAELCREIVAKMPILGTLGGKEK
jgi:chromosome partitioning protein